MKVLAKAWYVGSMIRCSSLRRSGSYALRSGRGGGGVRRNGSAVVAERNDPSSAKMTPALTSWDLLLSPHPEEGLLKVVSRAYF